MFATTQTSRSAKNPIDDMAALDMMGQSAMFRNGVFAQIPMKGILYWNSHAFNLTDQDTTMHAWLNFSFAAETLHPVQSIFDTSHIFSANAAPYTTQVICNDSVLPQGVRLFSLSSHTHKRGKHFSVTTSGGGGCMTLAPDVINMVVGNTSPIQALNSSGQPVTGLTWTTSNSNIVSLSSTDPPTLTATDLRD